MKNSKKKKTNKPLTSTERRIRNWKPNPSPEEIRMERITSWKKSIAKSLGVGILFYAAYSIIPSIRWIVGNLEASDLNIPVVVGFHLLYLLSGIAYLILSEME